MPKIVQEVVEVLSIASSVDAKVLQDIVEVLVAYTTPSPTTVSGAGVSQDIIEVLCSSTNTSGYVSQDVVEVLCAPEDSYSGTRPNTQVWVSVF